MIYRRHQAVQTHGNSPGWNSMSSAPRDGTMVELMCLYGVAPWYGLFRWTDECSSISAPDGTVHTYKTAPGWRNGDRGVSDEEFLRWRPHRSQGGAPYIDPTNGAQETNDYWLSAVNARAHNAHSRWNT